MQHAEEIKSYLEVRQMSTHDTSLQEEEDNKKLMGQLL